MTRLAGGEVVAKNSARIECVGAVDELNATVGLAAVTVAELGQEKPGLARLQAVLQRIQHELFNLGSLLATLPEDIGPDQPRIKIEQVLRLEREIDAVNGESPGLESFLLPGGSRLGAELHLARTVCRRAERRAVALAAEEELPGEALQYLNRLSDALFVWSRWANRVLGAPETSWAEEEAR